MKYIIKTCDGDEAEFISDKLLEFNLSKMSPNWEQEEDFYWITKKIEDDGGNIVAGYIGFANCWREAFLDNIWVDERYRNKGLGSSLIEDFEKEAEEKGCTLIHLDTFDWQAKDFYIKHGYQVFGTCDDCPKGHKRFYLVKYL